MARVSHACTMQGGGRGPSASAGCGPLRRGAFRFGGLGFASGDSLPQAGGGAGSAARELPR
eukprot:9710421-Lingulodinium_polyedra.AAC.1